MKNSSRIYRIAAVTGVAASSLLLASPAHAAGPKRQPTTTKPVAVKCIVPNVIGLNEVATVKVLTAAGCPRSYSDADGPAETVGLVIAQFPAAGTPLPDNSYSAVTYYVNSGPATSTVNKW